MARLTEVFRFELAYQFSRVSTRIYLAIFLALAFVLDWVFLLDAREDGYFFNAPLITAAITILASMAALLVTAGVAGDAATRDAEQRMDALLATTPLRKAAYLGGRVLGAFSVIAVLLLAVPAGLLAATRVPGLGAAIVGPFRAEGYLGAYFLFALPNAFVSTAVLFAIAAVSRRAVAAYAGAVLLFFASFLSEGFLGSRLGQWRLAKLIDPLGFTALRALWKSANALQKNTLLIPVDGVLLANRLAWLALACGVLAFAYARFRFSYASNARGSLRAEKLGDGATFPATRVIVPEARPVFGLQTRIRQLIAVTAASFRALVTGRGWLLAPIAAAIFVATAPQLLQVELGTPGAATTARIATILGQFELAFVLTLLTAIYAGELVWRERDARIQAIADVTPLPAWVSFGGKFLALALMLVAGQAFFLLAGVIVQITQGGAPIDLWSSIEILFGLELAGYLLFAVVAMAVHVLVNQKHVGNVVALLAFIAPQLERQIGVGHNLLLAGGAPSWTYSEMAGFGQVGPWCWFTSYWSGWALLLAVVAYLFRTRGESRGLRERLALARRRLTREAVALGAAALTIIGAAGGFIFYNTNVLNHYRSSAGADRRYEKYASIPQPVLAATTLRVELYPARGTATIRGNYRLENRSGAPIDTIHVITNVDVTTNDISFDRPSHAILADEDRGYQVYALNQPLQPGRSLRMSFDVAFAPRGFTNDGRDPSVLPNGTWIEHRGEQDGAPRQWLPVIGYRATDDTARPLTDRAARNDQRGREKIDFEAIVGTDAGQTAVAPGVLRRAWSGNGRAYFHYVAGAPISNIYAIFSARYAVHRARWGDVTIEIFHHPSHTANLARMVRSAHASLDYDTRNFGPYPQRELRLVEYPGAGGELGLTSYPGLIKYSEGFALVRPERDERRIDLPFAVMAHELGHQWFGHQLIPADVEGAPLLTESLAWYSGMLVVEKTLGRASLLRLLDVMRHEYLAPHETRAVPLLRAVRSIDAYRTGPFAMFALRESLGEARVNAALRNLLAKFDPRRPPYPTSLDLFAELRAVTPATMQPLLADLFEKITFWNLRMKSVDVKPAGDSTYRVTLRIEAQKLEADAAGQEKPVPMNDAITIAIFDAAGRTLYRQPHRIRSGAQTIALTITSARPPTRAAIDPDHALLDREPDDNIR